MRYVSPDQRLIGPEAAFEESGAAVLWERVRESMGAGRFWAVVLVLITSLTVAKSTATVRWVDGIDVIVVIALAGALLMSALALSPLRDSVGLAIGLVLSPTVAFAGAWPQIHARHPTDAGGLGLIGVWWQRISDGSAGQDPSFYLVLICLLMWVTGAWLAWCVLRWRKPMLGLIPGAAAFATNVLNFPQDQNGYTLAMLLLTLGLLLWTNYTGSIASATRANVKLTGDARWDFWESGLVAMAALIVLGIMLPPLSTADRTLDVESGLFSNWAQLQERLSHPGLLGTSRAGSGVTGFTDDVKLSGSLKRTRDIVFTYTIIGDYAGPRYFRGVDETVTSAGEWRYAQQSSVRQLVAKNQAYLYAEDYQKLAGAGVEVRVLHTPVPPNSDVIFYPGQLYRIDRLTLGSQVPYFQPRGAPESVLMYTLDRLSSVQPNTSAGRYNATVVYSTASQEDLQSAGTNYPDWLRGYTVLPQRGYRPPDVLNRIHELALTIVNNAGAKTPYDMAAAIETYLRNGQNFIYSLDAKAPEGTDPIDYFLFTSHKGYCEFFATAMGDMLRSLGVPVRLVNGFGPGTFDTQYQAFVVRGEDAHTWVEVYFPKYGWVPFEPTADPSNASYQVIARGETGINPCLTDNGCDLSSIGAGGIIGGATPSDGSNRGERNLGGDSGAIGRGIHIGSLDATALTRIAGIVIALLLLILVAALRYLRPRTVMSVWRRTLTLARLAGAHGRPGETPFELGRRLRRTFPETAEPMSTLANGFVVAAYAPPEVAEKSRASVMESWSALRPMLLRRVLSRLRPTRP
jgi:transglutaminase-like putative cysteine protease